MKGLTVAGAGILVHTNRSGEKIRLNKKEQTIAKVYTSVRKQSSMVLKAESF